jgi:dihydrofolate reductase
MAIVGIVAISKNYAIGKGGTLPWHYPADLKFFKKTTTGNAVVMGSTTWRSIGKPLPNRLNVVLSRSGTAKTPPEVMCLSSKDEVVSLSQLLVRDVFVIGGAQIFTALADIITKWIVTEVPIEVPDADTFMPAGFLDGFEGTETIDLGQGVIVKIMHAKGQVV